MIKEEAIKKAQELANEKQITFVVWKELDERSYDICTNYEWHYAPKDHWVGLRNLYCEGSEIDVSPGFITKTDQVKDLVWRGEYMAALKIAHKFKALKKEDKVALERCHGAHTNPNFYKQMGMNIQHLKDEGVRVLLELWGQEDVPCMGSFDKNGDCI